MGDAPDLDEIRDELLGRLTAEADAIDVPQSEVSLAKQKYQSGKINGLAVAKDEVRRVFEERDE